MKSLFLHAFTLVFPFLNLTAQTTTLFEDDFETPQTWSIFEEIVSNNACYGSSIGEVARSTDYAQTGTNGLRIWANKNQTVKSNHVIGSHIVYQNQGITGRLRYGTWAYCATTTSATTIGLTQSGPEISVQNTRTVGGVNYTYIAGIQFIGNQWVTDKWQIWHNGTWKSLKPSEISADLVANTWYYIELEFDFTTNEYISLKIQGGSLNVNLNLKQAFTSAPLGFKIGAEARVWQPSLFVTVESENLWTTCSVPYDNKVYYDNVSLKQVTSVLPIELVDFHGYTEGGKNFMYWATQTSKNLKNIEIERSGNGLIFEKIGAVNPSENHFIDERALSSNLYYRLKVNEIDGRFSYSKTISLSNESSKKVKIGLDTEGVLFVENKAHETANIFVFNSIGQLVFSKNNLFEVEKINLSDLPMGLYIIEIQTAKRRESVKVLKRS
jgi:hypothetical protein